VVVWSPAQPSRRRRWAALAAFAAVVLVLVPVASAGAAVVRLRVDWAPSDGRLAMTPPYLYAVADGEGLTGGSYFNECPVPPTCPAGQGTRWFEEDFAYPGSPRRISFVDDTATQYSTYHFAIKHPFGGFGPNVVGTATITHADARSYAVSFNIPPGPGGLVDGPQHELGTSKGLPRPRPGPRKEQCTVEDLKEFHSFYGLLKSAVAEFAYRWRKGAPLILNNVYACGHGKITGRVQQLAHGRKLLIAKGKKILNYKGRGRAGAKLKLTKRGRTLKARRGRFRALVTIRVYDADGAKVTYRRKTTLRRK
jgi:hypothetical protein